MWRFANYIYRAFRNVATHRCPQDIIVPVTTVCNKDEETKREKKNETLTQCESNIHHIIKKNQFSCQNIEKLQEYLRNIAYQQLNLKHEIVEQKRIEPASKEAPALPPPVQPEATLDSLLQADETCMKTLKSLSDLNDETTSIIDNQLAIEALEAGNTKLGIEILQASVKDGRNAVALYNLGICYERGIGVEQDRAKACDYYRQASRLGHAKAQFNLTLLSNKLDTNETEEEKSIESIPAKPRKFRLSFVQNFRDEQSSSWSDYHINLTKTLACLT